MIVTAVCGKTEHAGAFIDYVDDFLAAGPRSPLQSPLAQLLKLWKGSARDFLGREEGDVDALRFLGLDTELGPERWYISQATSMPACVRCTPIV